MVSYMDICLGAPVILRQWDQHFERVCICLCMCELHVKRLEKPFSYLEHHSRAGRTLAIGPRGPDSTLTVTHLLCGPGTFLYC